ncbi:DUF6431 domain-containing protein [Heliomicrobium modesticaldum]|nr:DUF6431 domain-containing protein [Heliomicrobium modesticaldum]
MFFVRSAEQIPCPCCNGALNGIGSRRRKCYQDTGERITLIIRRCRCAVCKRIHHELPDILVPYKRYSSKSIETVITGGAALTVPADESTLVRWRGWFLEMVNHFLGCLLSIAKRFGHASAEERSGLPESALQRIWRYVGDACGWLARVVRPVANSNLWRHTCFAFLS